MRHLQVSFRSLFAGFNQTKGLVKVCSHTANIMLSPHHQLGGFHLLHCDSVDLVGTAEHPGQDAHPIGITLQKLGRFAVWSKTEQTLAIFRTVLSVLKIFSHSGDEKTLPR
jgi:hypothetical protein